MPDEQEVGVLFPFAGVDVTCEFGRQPPDTAAVGANVRAFEVIQFRSRGGSRCGLTKYVDQQVNGVTSPVQHLAVLVDPEEPSLNGPADTSDVSGVGDYIPDPSTNNLIQRNFTPLPRYVRKIGSGRVPNKVKNKHPGDGTFTGNLTPTTLGDGDLFMTFETGDTGNGNYNGGSFNVEGIVAPPPLGINSDTPFQTWVVGSGPFDSLVANLGNTFAVTVTVVSVANGTDGMGNDAFYQSATIKGIP